MNIIKNIFGTAYTIHYYNYLNGWIYDGYFKDPFKAEEYIKVQSKKYGCPYRIQVRNITTKIYKDGKQCLT